MFVILVGWKHLRVDLKLQLGLAGSLYCLVYWLVDSVEACLVDLIDQVDQVDQVVYQVV